MPATTEDRAKLTVLARMQRVENAISGMGETMGNMFRLLRNIDDKLDQVLNSNNRPSRAILSRMHAKFSSTQEEIP